MIGYDFLNKSMNGIKTVSDGQAIMSNGKLTAIIINATDIITTNLTSTNIYGTLLTASQTFITSLGNLISLTVTGLTSLGTTTTGALSTNINMDFSQSGTGKIDQTSSFGDNKLSSITQNSNAGIVQSGTGIISQSGSSTNAFKASNITGQLGLTGNFVQTSGSNTLFDTTIGNITQSGSNKIVQTGTDINVLKTTVIDGLTVLNNMQIPDNVTIPGATYTDNSVYTGTAVIDQTGSGTNILKTTNIISDLDVSGNFYMSGGSSSCFLKTPTISGSTICASLTQTSGTSALRGLTCNQLDINSNFDLNFYGNGKIGQTTSTGTNLMNAITLNSNRDITFAGTGRINQNSSGGANIFQASAFNDDVVMASNKLIKFTNSLSRKMILYDANVLTQFNHFGFGVENNILRYNTNVATDSHVFGGGNNITGTGYTENMRINSTGLGIGISPSFKLHVLGNTKLDGPVTFTGNLNNVTIAELATLIGSNTTTTIQTQLNNAASTGSGNSTAISTLQTKTTDLTYSSGVSTFANNLSVGGNLIVTGNSTLNNDVTIASSKSLKFANSVGKKLLLWDTATTAWNYYGSSIEATTARYNVEYLANHVFSQANAATATGFTELMRLNNIGLGINCVPSTYKLDVLGNTRFTGNLEVTGTIASSTHSGTMSGVNETLSGFLTVGGLTTTNSLTVTNDAFFNGSGTFPTTNTGGSQGLALYFNRSGGNGEIDYLARGQGGPGGHRFYRSNTSTSPTLLLDITDTSADFKNNVSVVGTLGVTCQITAVNEVLSGTLNVTGQISGVNQVLSGTLDVTGKITAVNQDLTGALRVYGNTRIDGTIYAYDNLSLAGQSFFAGQSYLNGGCETTNLYATGNAQINGNLDVNGITKFNNKTYYPGMIGAYLIDGGLNTTHYPIVCSNGRYGWWYQKQAMYPIAQGVSVTTGSIYSGAQLNLDNVDDIYLVNPGFRLVVYFGPDWTLGTTLDFYNQELYPIYVVPSSVNNGTSCKLYFNGVEIV